MHSSWYLTYIKQWNCRIKLYKHIKTCIQINIYIVPYTCGKHNEKGKWTRNRDRERIDAAFVEWNNFTKISNLKIHWLHKTFTVFFLLWTSHFFPSLALNRNESFFSKYVKYNGKIRVIVNEIGYLHSVNLSLISKIEWVDGLCVCVFVCVHE